MSQRSPAALHVEESSLIAEIGILEYLLHQSITLRLNNLYPIDPFQPSNERNDNLKRAYYYSLLIQKILDSLKITFYGGEIPMDESLSKRLEFAQLIGFSFFYNPNGRCWDGNMTEIEWKLVADKIFELNWKICKNDTSSLPALVELGVQYYLLTNQQKKVSGSLANDYYKRLEQRLKSIKEDNLMGRYVSEHKTPFEHFRKIHCETLRGIYHNYDPPLISKFCENFSENVKSTKSPIVNHSITQESHSLPMAPTQFDIMTQPPTGLIGSLNSSPKKNKITGIIAPVVTEKSKGSNVSPLPTIAYDTLTQPFTLGLDIPSPHQSPIKQLFPTSLPHSPRQKVSFVSNENQGLAIKQQEISPLMVRSPSKRQTLTASSPEKVDIPKTKARLVLEIEEETAETMKKVRHPRLINSVPPEAFRSVLCKDDDELASIAEGRHENVKAYLRRRLLAEEEAEENPEPTSSPSKISNVAIFDRHESAERIGWSSPNDLIAGSPKKSKVRERRPWSAAETKCLIKGYKKHGNNWAVILNEYPKSFQDRTNVDLKDKARNLADKGLL